MEIIQHLGTLLGLSFISGINLYATVAVVGLAIKNGLVSGLPPDLAILANDAVIAVAVLLYLVEFFMDKIPGLDTAWDALHTLIRPLGGALLALMQVGESGPAVQVIVFLLGASLASTAHVTKAGLRLLVNASPEPVSNIVVSVGEDVGAIGLAYLSVTHPLVAFFITLALLVLVGLTLPILLRTLKMLVSALISWLFSWFGPRREAETGVALSASQQEFLERHRSADETPRWAGPGYVGRIPGLPRCAKVLVVVTNRNIHCLRRRLGGYQHQHLRLDEIRRHQLFPGRLLSKLVVTGDHATWSVQLLPSVAQMFPTTALNAPKDSKPT